VRVIGKRSVSSFLTIVLAVAWWGIALCLALIVVMVAIGSNVAVRIGPDGSPSIEAGPHVKMAIPVSFRVDDSAGGVTAPSLGIEDAQIQDVHGTLRFTPRMGAFVVANLILVIGLLALALWVLGLLRAVLRTLRDGQPFVAANATRVRWIAWAVILGEFVRSAVVYFESYYALTHFSAGGLSFEARPQINVFAIINGLIILVIAEVFRAGTRLEEEQSLTV
jgi:hypothetical protein